MNIIELANEVASNSAAGTITFIDDFIGKSSKEAAAMFAVSHKEWVQEGRTVRLDLERQAKWVVSLRKLGEAEVYQVFYRFEEHKTPGAGGLIRFSDRGELRVEYEVYKQYASSMEVGVEE